MSKSGKAVLVGAGVAAVGALGALAVNWAVSRSHKGADGGALESLFRTTRESDLMDEVSGQPVWPRPPEPIGREWWQYLEEEGHLDSR